jgi:hypothetical protein
MHPFLNEFAARERAQDLRRQAEQAQLIAACIRAQAPEAERRPAGTVGSVVRPGNLFAWIAGVRRFPLRLLRASN